MLRDGVGSLSAAGQTGLKPMFLQKRERRGDGRESRTVVSGTKQAVVVSSQLRPIRQGLKASCTRLL